MQVISLYKSSEKLWRNKTTIGHWEVFEGHCRNSSSSKSRWGKMSLIELNHGQKIINDIDQGVRIYRQSIKCLTDYQKNTLYRAQN